MEYIRYKKPTDAMAKTGMTKGVKTAPMTVSFKDGKVPYVEGQILIVNFKQNKVPALITGINEHSVTVSINGIDRKKVIRFENIVQVLETV
jgi:hypothetical protein